MAQRTIWRVEFSGGIQTKYVVLGRNPNEAAQRGWVLDKVHVSHKDRVSVLVQVAGNFEDLENDIPQTSEDQLRADLAALVARVASLEAKVP